MLLQSKKKSALFLLITIASSLIFSQQKQINALKAKLKDSSLNDSIRIKYLGDLGWYYGNVSIDSAFFYTKKGLNLSIKSNNLKGIGQSYNDLGIIHYRTSKYDSARYYYRKSLTIRTKINDSIGLAGLYSKIGISFQQNSILDSALYFNNKSLRMYEALGMKRHVIINQNNIANIYQNLNQFDKALKIHLSVLATREKTKIPAELAESYVNIGNVYQRLNELEKSKNYYDKAIAISEKHNLIRNLSIVYNNYGNIYKEESKMDLALDFYKKAYTIRKNLKDSYGLASVTGNLGVLYFEAAKFKTAEPYLHESLLLSKKLKAKELELSAYKVLLMLKAYLKQPDSTIFYQKKYDDLNNIIRNENVTKQVLEIETKYQTEKIEKENAIQKEQLLTQELAIKNKTLFTILLASALIILGIIFFAVYKKNQLKRKQLKKEIDLKDALATIKTQNRLQEQRLRISRDLHDNIGSQLTFIISSIDNLKYISKDANKKLKDKLTSISGFTSDTIHQLRDTIWAMNKSEITVEDLHTRILSYVEKAKVASPNITFKVEYNIDLNMVFTSLIGMNIFRVIQEAINNSIKYSEANQLEILLRKKDNLFEAIVKDNGNGFDIKSVDLGNGLSNMEKRMSEVGGKVKIISEKEKGTEIIVAVALKNTSNDV
ncbi:tetratricopeptide repeat-containing sensor histidine kinase [Polaribacter aquimarinus]|uniref:Two-component sensor histidine kinase n=1 Tax=Polaribacter aquimarinus TaxID=2100726 RepID=A0A2U2JCW3_9FLAO|nr:tetratricopeptide repeat-containing sensor histidine kinase [Polaribacter aquimarinus]PWG06176.1 two-component sensor histidine kinase [Polaribacter aquimarinus]